MGAHDTRNRQWSWRSPQTHLLGERHKRGHDPAQVCRPRDSYGCCCLDAHNDLQRVQMGHGQERSFRELQQHEQGC